MSWDMRSLQLDVALLGAAALDRVAARIPERITLPTPPTLPRLSAYDPRAAVRRGIESLVGHVDSYRRRPDGLFVPATPALLGRASPIADAVSGARRPRNWADAIDLGGLVTFLRSHHGGVKVAEKVAAETGEPLGSVRKWLAHETRPGFRATLVLVCHYGPPLLEACLRRDVEWLAATRGGLDRLTLARELAAMRERISLVLGAA